MVLLTIWLALVVETMAAAQASNDVIGRVRRMVEEVQAASYPELKDARIEIKLFDSSSDYFQTRFTFTSFLFKKRLRYLLRVNRNLFTDGVPEDGLRAILAHELGHIVYYKSRNRLALLGLVRLVCKDFMARFERGTDLETIQRGYGDGLKSYRLWLYGHIPLNKLEEKKRNYFSPAELDALQLRLRAQPELMKQWRKHPPRSLMEIEQPALVCGQTQGIRLTKTPPEAVEANNCSPLTASPVTKVLSKPALICVQLCPSFSVTNTP